MEKGKDTKFLPSYCSHYNHLFNKYHVCIYCYGKVKVKEESYVKYWF